MVGSRSPKRGLVAEAADHGSFFHASAFRRDLNRTIGESLCNLKIKARIFEYKYSTSSIRKLCPLSNAVNYPHTTNNSEISVDYFTIVLVQVCFGNKGGFSVTHNS